MAILTTDLSDFLIPKISNYEPDFGTMKQSGGLTTQEVSENIMYPLLSQRGFTVTESSQTSDVVKRDSKFLIMQSNITLTIGSGIDGISIDIINKSTGDATVLINNQEVTCMQGKRLRYTWQNDTWQKIAEIEQITSTTNEDGRIVINFNMLDGQIINYITQPMYIRTQAPTNPQVGDIWLEEV